MNFGNVEHLVFTKKNFVEAYEIISKFSQYSVYISPFVTAMANNYDLCACAEFLNIFYEKLSNAHLLKVVDILRNVLFVWKKDFDVINFQRCCFIISKRFDMVEKFVRVMANLYQSNCKRAQLKLYFWWIQLCYDMKKECGKRMAERAFDRIEAMYNEQP